MKIVELLISEISGFLGFETNSLVDKPAIQENFFAFNEVEIEDILTLQIIKLALEEEMGVKFDQETEEISELTIGDYNTRHFDIDSQASALYKKIVSGELDVDMDVAKRSAKLQDVLFWIKKHTVDEMESASYNDVVAAQTLAYEILQLAEIMGLTEEHQYVYTYVQEVRDLAGDTSLDVDVTSLPAYTNEVTESNFSFASEDQQIVVGPLMIPNKQILRVDEEGNPFYVFFSKDTVKAIAEKMMKDKLLDRLNANHDPNQPVEGHMMETWIIEDPKKDKASIYGFDHLPAGTWMGMYRITDNKTWARVKSKELRGYSVEAYLKERVISQ